MGTGSSAASPAPAGTGRPWRISGEQWLHGSAGPTDLHACPRGVRGAELTAGEREEEGCRAVDADVRRAVGAGEPRVAAADDPDRLRTEGELDDAAEGRRPVREEGSEGERRPPGLEAV